MMLWFGCVVRIIRKGRHASKFDFQAECVGDGARAAGCRDGPRPRQADRAIVARSTAVRADRAHVRAKGRARFTRCEGGRLVAVSAEQPDVPGRFVARARHPRPLRRAADADRHDERRRERAVPRFARRDELGFGTRRSRLHVPARSSRHSADERGRGAGYAGSSRRSDDAARRADAGARRPRTGAGGRYLHGEARRHAVEDRDAAQARHGDARADARRDVQEQRERVRRQQHEPAAHRRHHDDPVRRRGRSGESERGDQGRSRAGVRLARLSRSRRRGGAVGGRRPGGSRSDRTHRYGGRGEGGRGVRRTRSVARIARGRTGQGRRRRSRGSDRARQAAEGSAAADRRSREDAAGHATRRRAQEPDDGSAADAKRRGEGQGRAVEGCDADHDSAAGTRGEGTGAREGGAGQG